MRLSGTKLSSIHQYQGLGNQLWDLAGSRPSLDLRFADNKSLVDATTGQNLIDFSRASGGTYVDSQGVIRNATTNLLTYSEEFDSPTWLKTGTEVTANQATAPDGTLTADKLEQTVTTGNRYVYRGSLQSIAPVGQYTVSVFIKPVSPVETFRLRVDTPGDGGKLFAYNFTTEVKSELNCTGNVISVGDGWYRMSASFTTGFPIANVVYDLGVHDGSIGDYVYLWGAQLEESSTVGEYIPTTSSINSAPRFDHDPETGESLGLLVEESRTNLMPGSEDISYTYYSTSGSGFVSNSTTAPSGGITADSLIEDGSNGRHDYFNTSLVSTTAAPHVFSIYVKPNGRTWIKLRFDVSGSFKGVYFELVGNGTVGTADTGYAGSIQRLANGWYRCSAALTTLATSYITAVRLASADGTDSYQGDGTSGIYLWGAQLEEGSGPPSSYIPTEGTAVTRAADVARITGTNFSSWYNQTEGTVFADANGLGSAVPSGDFQSLATFSDGTNDTRIELGYLTSSSSYFNIREAGVQSVALAPTVTTAARKLAGAFDSSSAATTANGDTPVNDLSVMVPTVDKLDIGGANGSLIKEFHGTIRRLTYWPQRLSNEVLQRITQ